MKSTQKTPVPSANTLAVTRIVHSCHLIEIDGLTFLTDPWFSEKPMYHPGEPLAMTVEELPSIDAVLISHNHYDHCDFEAFSAYRDHSVPIVSLDTVKETAIDHGFTNFREMGSWDTTTFGSVTITSVPAKHGVKEITFMISGKSGSVYFAGDTLVTRDQLSVAEKFPSIDIALVPTNGLRIRPMFNKKVVMSARDAAKFVGHLKPKIAIPQHYAFTGGSIADKLITKGDRNPQHFVTEAAKYAPSVKTYILETGERFVATPS